jgi:tetratricopeptide (TPR) repeat protein
MRRVLRIIAVAVCTLSLCGGVASGSIPPGPNALEGARASAVDGDLAPAIVRLEPYVTAHPNDAVAARMLGDLYFRNADPVRAEAVWRAQLRRNPDDRETHERLGSLYAAHNQVADAIGEFQQSLPLRAGLLQLIALLRRTNGLDAFVARARAGERRYPDDPWQVTLYATLLEVTHHADEALPLYTRVVELAPLANCEALASRANDLLDLHREADAIVDLRACLRSNRDDYAGLTILGSIYLHPGTYDQARPLLEHALEVLPDGVEALIDLGYLDDETGDREAAMRYYRRALAADPLRPEGYIDLGFDYALARRYAQAEAMYSAGLVAAPDSGRLHFLLGAAYRSEGKFALAQAQFEAALAADETEVVNAARDALATLPNMLGYTPR